MLIDDARKNLTVEERKEYMYLVVATDTFLSNWGLAKGGNSYFGVACQTMNQVKDVIIRMKKRTDFVRVRLVSSKYKPNSRYCSHFSVILVSEFTYH